MTKRGTSGEPPATPPTGVPRGVIVLGGATTLVVGLTGLLTFVAPPPLNPGFLPLEWTVSDAPPLMAVSPSAVRPTYDASARPTASTSPADTILRPYLPVAAWGSIEVRTVGRGDSTLIDPGEDHFVIGDGTHARDGEIRVGHRWTRQQPPGGDWTTGRSTQGAPPITIRLLSVNAHAIPTDAQRRSLRWLVEGLRNRLDLPDERVATAWH